MERTKEENESDTTDSDLHNLISIPKISIKLNFV